MGIVPCWFRADLAKRYRYLDRRVKAGAPGRRGTAGVHRYEKALLMPGLGIAATKGAL
jgi:hypothetical protein